MPVTCDEIRDFAATLAVDGSPEPALRASISRSYYAVFHTALPIARPLPKAAKEKRTDGHIGHEGVRERLMEWQVDPCCAHLRYRAKTLAQAFEKCRKLRVMADYELLAEVSVKDAQKQCRAANEAIAVAHSLKNEYLRSKAA